MKASQIQQEYRAYLVLKNYRPLTIKAYSNTISRFLQFCIINKQDQKSAQDYAKSYLLKRFNHGNSWSTVNMDYSALIILFRHILKLEWSYDFVPRPRALKKLPQVLSVKQIEKMINGINNLKHKSIVLLLYSTGIRSSELVNLDIADICLDRSQLHVRLGKGGRDRIVQIPTITLEFIKAYLWKYNPKQFLFEGQTKHTRYSASSIRNIIVRALHKQGSQLKVNPHALRHSYATHHIMNGTDLISLQKQMGHNNIKTTISYIHLCPSVVQQIKHPIEKMEINKPLTKLSVTS